ncbi:hypothetical protein FQR65_LT10730 [Abscondita terminalis]|nr:hypothetical protein FQR65_LT10730 [Abscondita terminalis]
MSTKPEYQIRSITEVDTEPVLDHLREFFFRTEPMNESVKLLENKDSRCISLEKYCLKCMSSGVSYLAVTESNKIVSVILNAVCDVDQQSHEQIKDSDAKYEKIINFVNFLGEKGTEAILKKFPGCKKVLDIKILSTDTKWRGKGIAGALVECSRKVGFDKGCELIRIDCSSYYSAKVAEKLGFDLIYTFPFADYKEDGKSVFLLPHPHVSATVYVQKLTTP